MRPRTGIATLAVAAVLAVATSGRVEAQGQGYGAESGGTRTYPTPEGVTPFTPGYVRSTATYATYYGSSAAYAGGPSGYVSPYSYYAAIPPAPARIYVDYANSGFNFYGRPYGHPNDRWSWAALNSSQNLLDRYYYAPVR